MEKRKNSSGLRKVKAKISTNERKIETGIQQEIKNDTEI